jgi:hypothetical protein
MQSATSAEWILGRLTTKERAASIIGDLVEIEKHKGQLWFWLSVAGIVVSLAWRRPVAFLAGSFAGVWTGYCFFWATFYRARWMPVLEVFTLVGSTLCFFFMYSVVRYGIRERASQLALAWAGLITMVIFCWQQPVVLTLCVIAALAITAASTLKRSFRTDSLVVFVSVAVACGVKYLETFLRVSWGHFLFYWQPWADSEYYRAHPVYNCVPFASFFLSYLGVTLFWSWLHDRLTPGQKTLIAE